MKNFTSHCAIISLRYNSMHGFNSSSINADGQTRNVCLLNFWFENARRWNNAHVHKNYITYIKFRINVQLYTKTTYIASHPIKHRAVSLLDLLHSMSKHHSLGQTLTAILVLLHRPCDDM